MFWSKNIKQVIHLYGEICPITHEAISDLLKKDHPHIMLYKYTITDQHDRKIDRFIAYNGEALKERIIRQIHTQSTLHDPCTHRKLYALEKEISVRRSFAAAGPFVGYIILLLATLLACLQISELKFQNDTPIIERDETIDYNEFLPHFGMLVGLLVSTCGYYAQEPVHPELLDKYYIKYNPALHELILPSSYLTEAPSISIS